MVYQIADEISEPLPSLKIWLDTGTHEEGWERVGHLRDQLVAKGWRLYGDLQYLESDCRLHRKLEVSASPGLGQVMRRLPQSSPSFPGQRENCTDRYMCPLP